MLKKIGSCGSEGNPSENALELLYKFKCGLREYAQVHDSNQ